MLSQLFRHFCIFALVACTQHCFADDTDRIALSATADFLFATTEEGMTAQIAGDATFGAQDSGSLLKGIANRVCGEPIAEQIDSVTLFDRSQVHTLQKVFPNGMWKHVMNRIGDDRGAFVRFRHAKSSSPGSAPAGTPAMIVVVVRDYDDGPKIAHLSSDDEE